jgi:hypothetical protein
MEGRSAEVYQVGRGLPGRQRSTGLTYRINDPIVSDMEHKTYIINATAATWFGPYGSLYDAREAVGIINNDRDNPYTVTAAMVEPVTPESHPYAFGLAARRSD